VAQNPGLTQTEWNKQAVYLHSKIPENDFKIEILPANKLLEVYFQKNISM
jgi:hypothetical protein